MNLFAIVTDSSCDLPPELAEELEITALPLALELEDRTYYNHLDGRDISPEDFYQKIREGKRASSSAVSVGAYTDAFRPMLAAGTDVLCLSFSSGLSNTCQASQIAARELSEEFPERKIFVVDTLCASLGQGLLIYLAARRKQEGGSIEEVRDFAEDTKLRICHWFTVDDLNHLKRGGRISPATALLGTMLQIKPVMHVDDEGRLVPVSKVRGRKAALQSLVEHMQETAVDPETQTVFISHGDCREDAEYVAALVKDRLGVQRVIVHFVGPVIGAHSGPGTLALFFVGTHR